jgi:hypothetical protein
LVTAKPGRGTIAVVATARQQVPDGYSADMSPLPSRHSQLRAKNARTPAGGPPALEVGSSCEAAGRGSVVLGRDKKACLGDETTAQDTLKQNWSKYAAPDKTDCVGMVTTSGPAIYVELLALRSCATRAISAVRTRSRPTTPQTTRGAADAINAATSAGPHGMKRRAERR